MKISKIGFVVALVGVLACGKDSGKEKEKEVVNALQDAKKKSSTLLVTQIATEGLFAVVSATVCDFDAGVSARYSRFRLMSLVSGVRSDTLVPSMHEQEPYLHRLLPCTKKLGQTIATTL